MDQQNQGTNSSLPVETPMKRKRGRPRKDGSQVKRERLTKSNSVSGTHHRLGASRSNEEDDDDEMVGQVVSGVCEGSFDAGYFVTVKVGNTDTLLRGAVFVPGLFTPISAANDVAPYAKMYKRKEIPIPVLSPQGSAPRLRRKNKQPVLPENTAPMAVDQAPSSDVQCGPSLSIKTNSASTNVALTYNAAKNNNPSSSAEILCSLFMPQDQPASGKVPLTDNLPKIETVFSSGGKFQAQISTPVVPEKVLNNQQGTGIENHIGTTLYSLENSSITVPMTDYLLKNDTNSPLEGEGRIENRVLPVSANQVLPVLQFGAPLMLEDQLSSVPVVPTHDLLKDDRVLHQGEKVQHEKELHTDKGRVSLSDRPSDAAFAVENQSASPVILSAEKSPRKDDGFPLEGEDMPRKTLELGLGDHQPVSVTEMKDFHKIIKPDEMFQETEAEADVGATKELKLDAESRAYVDVFPGNQAVVQMTQVQQAVVCPADEPKSQHLELEYMPFQLIDKPVDGVLMEKQVSPKNDYPPYMQSEFTVKDFFSGNASFQSNRRPFNDEEGSLSSSNTIQQPAMNFPGDADQTELKLGAEGSEPASMFDSQMSHPVSPSKDLNSGFKDAILSTNLEINPVAATRNPVASEDVSQTEDDEQRAEA